MGVLRPFQPLKSCRKSFIILWLETQQKAGKRANRGEELDKLDKSGSLSGLHNYAYRIANFLGVNPSALVGYVIYFCVICVSVICGKALFLQQRADTEIVELVAGPSPVFRSKKAFQISGGLFSCISPHATGARKAGYCYLRLSRILTPG